MPRFCGWCEERWYPARHGSGHNRKLHSEECARNKDCKCPPLHDKCEAEVSVPGSATAKIRVFCTEFAACVLVCNAQMRPDRVHHPPKDPSPITEKLPNESTLVAHRAANGKPLQFVANIRVPQKGSATAKRKTVQDRSELLETLIEQTVVPPNKQFKSEALPDRVAQLKHLMKRDFLRDAFKTAATEMGIGSRQLTTHEQLELDKLLK